MTEGSGVSRGPVIALVVSSAGGVESVREEFVAPAVEKGWTVAITTTDCRSLAGSTDGRCRGCGRSMTRWPCVLVIIARAAQELRAERGR